MTQRAAVILEARSWIGTPFRHAARVKGAGVDCAQFLAAVYEAAGVVEPVAFPSTYSPDWFLHRSDDVYIRGLEHHARRVAVPRPGDIATFQFGRAVSHAAVVLEWPTIIHAFVGVGVVIDDAVRNARLSERFVGCFSPFPEGE